MTVCRSIEPGAGELTDVGVEGDVGGALRLERVPEVAGSTAHVEHQLAGQVVVAGELLRGVERQRGVEPCGVGLLVAELPEEVQRPRQVGAPRSGPRQHPQTLADK